EQVAQRLRGRAIKTDRINELAEATGGEPVFLAPLLERLLETADREPAGADVQQVVETMCANQEFDHVFWHLALHLWSDWDVRRIVKQLQAGREEKPAVP